MNDRKLTVLTVLAGVLTVGELGSAVEIGLGKDPGGAVFAVVFGVFFGLATWLLRRGRVTAGAVFTGLLCLFEIAEFPGWPSTPGTMADMRRLPSAPASGRVAAVAAGAAVAVTLAGAVAAAAFDQAGSAVFAETLSFGIAVSAVAVILPTGPATRNAGPCDRPRLGGTAV